MKSDLAGTVHGVEERFVPETMRGRLIEAEHLARYWWAARLVSGKRVLDAGCGTAYGSKLLAEARAGEVTGIDVAGDVLDEVRDAMPSNVRLEQADIRKLPFDDGTFDVVVCFEVLEHLNRPEAAIAELARVLTEGGLLCASSPNRGVYPPGNPHHEHEFEPEELSEALEEHFAAVALFRQHDWLTSAVLEDDLYAGDGSRPLTGVDFRKVIGREPGSELLTVALASNAPLPDAAGSAVLTHDLEVRQLIEGYDRLEVERAEIKRAAFRAEEAASQARAAATAAERRVLELESSEALHRQTIYRQQRELEDVLARVGTEAEFAEAQAATKQLQRRIAELERAIAEMKATRVWAVGTSFWRLRDFVLRRR